MNKYKKGQITLQIRVPIKIAVSILGRLFGCGVLTREQYQKKLEQVDKESADKEKRKLEKLARILEKGCKNDRV